MGKLRPRGLQKGLVLLRAQLPLRELKGLTHTPVSPGINKPRPGEKAGRLTVAVHVSPARNESYHYGRIRRKMPLESAHTCI